MGFPATRSFLHRCVFSAGFGLLLSLPLLARQAGTGSADTPLAWPETFDPLARAWHPADKMVNQQNPPDFGWPAVAGATSYDLHICRDAAGTDIAYRADNLPRNFHNFPLTFEPATYYWRVRFHQGTRVSAWSPARRFRIDPDAWPFPVPPIDDLIGRIPTGHPRVWTTPGELGTFQARAQGPAKEWFAPVLARVRQELTTPLPAEPTFAFSPSGPRTPEWQAAHIRLRQYAWDGYGGAAVRLLRTAFCHLVTKDPEIGASAVAQLLNLCTWDPNGATGYRTHDQIHRAIALYGAMAYDWCYDLLSPEQRRQVLEMIRTRTLTMVDHLLQRRPINERPYDSHGWTAFGYIGSIALATLHDLPEAQAWLEATLSAYINVMPPWGGEDGGWAQGVSYWQYSQRSNRTLADILLPATGFNLYNKAFFRNNAYFPIYMFPHGSPRSHFGDGNEYRPANHNVGHLRRFAQLYQDPVLQWAWQVLGDAPIDQHADYLGGSLDNYFAIDAVLEAKAPPASMPRARWYRDIDWVAMHSDLADPERVSLYFKSSPYGSFNHSHADQNSFVLNAYGEALAIDGGYYDGYGSAHDTRFTRQTLAHNAITHNGGRGQPIFDLMAKGRITGFVTHATVDACSGDATAAYKGALGKAVRHILYLRPDTFVVIDELAAPAGREMAFEWWLQALKTLELDRDQAGATITQGRANLRVRFAHPAGLIAQTHTEFIGPPNVYKPGEQITPALPVPQALGDPSSENQIRAVFRAPATERTTFVATLQATRAGIAPADVKAHRVGNALELVFAGGERVVVRLTDDDEVTTGNLTFRGTAAAIVGDTVLLVNGDRLAQAGKPLIGSIHPVTAVLGPREAAVSCVDDTTVRLQVDHLRDLRDERGRAFPRTRWSASRDSLEIECEPGTTDLHFER